VARTTLPTVTLMHPTLVSTPFHQEGLIFEEKVDGYRMVAYKADRSVKLVSRQGKSLRSVSLSWRRPSRLWAPSPSSSMPSWRCLISSSSANSSGSGEGDVATPPMLMAFDLLELDGEDQRKRPLRERRQALEHLLRGERLILPVRRLSPNGLEAWKEVLRAGYEGLVAKDPESPYVPRRTLKWLKVKQPKYREAERGWEPKR
jgi:bifunctional non-homologous end joining protein LigD